MDKNMTSEEVKVLVKTKALVKTLQKYRSRYGRTAVAASTLFAFPPPMYSLQSSF